MIERRVTRRRWRVVVERQRDKKRELVGIANTELEIDDKQRAWQLTRGWRFVVEQEDVELECFQMRDYYGRRALELTAELQLDVDRAALSLERAAEELRDDFDGELAHRGIEGLHDVVAHAQRQAGYLVANLSLASLMRTNQRLTAATQAYREQDLCCRLAQQSILPDNSGDLELLVKELESEQRRDFRGAGFER